MRSLLLAACALGVSGCGATPNPSVFDPARAACVGRINTHRQSLNLPPLSAWKDQHSCADAQAASDGDSGTNHGAFGKCGEMAQNECPGWGIPETDSIVACTDQMWAEGPGEDYEAHGHYINMTGNYTRVACGFARVDGKMWAVQDFK